MFTTACIPYIVTATIAIYEMNDIELKGLEWYLTLVLRADNK